MRRLLADLEPAGRVEVEALDEPRCPSPKLGRQGGEDLEPGRGHHGTQAELRRRTGKPGQEQRLGLVRGHPGQPRAVPVDQPDAAVRATFRVDRDPRLAQRIDVTVDAPDRDLELPGEGRGSHLAAGLEEQEKRHEAGCTHPRSLAQI